MTSLIIPRRGREQATLRLRAGRIRFRPRRLGLWWLNPAGALLLVVPLSVGFAYELSDRDYLFFYGTPKALTGGEALLFLAGAGCCAVGALLPVARVRARPSMPWPDIPDFQRRRLEIAGTATFWATSVGNLAFLASGFLHGGSPTLLIHTLLQQSNFGNDVKSTFSGVTGVTSLTQVAMAFVTIDCILISISDRKARHVRRLVIVLVSALLRSFFFAERLAILEVVVPALVYVAAALRQRHGGVGKLMPAVPAAALPLLLVIFGAFEYSRSWVFYRSRTDLSYPHFVVQRLAGYYATSVNNGALNMQYGHFVHQFPLESFDALWTTPGLAQLNLYERFTGGINYGSLFPTLLIQHGAPQFTNPGGLSTPFFDLGDVGGLLYFLLAGLLIGITYRSFREGRLTGVMLYPILFTGILELPRYLYWVQGRVVPSYVAILLVAYFLRRPPVRVRRGLGSLVRR